MRIYCQGQSRWSEREVVSVSCLGRWYCQRGIPMLKTSIQLPVIEGGEPAAWMLSLCELTEEYAEQTLLRAICEVYDSLPTVAEKMHFEPYGYRQVWQTSPHPGSPGLLTVHIETVLTHGRTVLRQAVETVTVRVIKEE